MKIVHLTSVHPRTDTRIFLKMCKYLAKEFKAVSLVVADGKGNEINSSVEIHDVGNSIGSRIKRMTKGVFGVYKQAKKLNGDVYHLHDPELIFIGWFLRMSGKKVIFDAHEDFPKQILSKPYMPKYVKKILSVFFIFIEFIVLRWYSAVITATPAIAERMKNTNKLVENINNYPIVGELKSSSSSNLPERNEFIFLGGMSKIRGIKEIVDASSIAKIKLNLVGSYMPEKFGDELHLKCSFDFVEEHGFLDRNKVSKLLRQCFAGLVTYLPEPNHIEALPNKMFEYMSAGVPVIASDYPLWNSIIEDANCGICVDPEDPESIAKAVTYLSSNSNIVKEMSKNGIDAIENKYNWDSEMKKLIKLYESLAN